MDKTLLARSISERIFARHSAMLEKLIANSNTSTHILERHLLTLDNLWTALQEKHDTYVLEFVTDPAEISANQSLIDTYHMEYIRIEAACDKIISAVKTAESASSATTMSNSIKLERVKFRTFDGDVRKYPKFKSEFEKYVKPLCNSSQLPFVLKSYLCDSVRREVENLDHDMDAKWKRLDEKYGTVQRQIDSIMYDFKHLPACIDMSSTLKMIHLVETADSDLKCINASDELENHLIISYIEKSMSKLMLENWAEKIAGEKDRESSKTKFQKLLEFLQHWRWLIEYNDADIRKSPPSDYSTETHVENCFVHHTEMRVMPSSHSATLCRSDRKCLVHPNAAHPVWRCRSFRAMTLPERDEVIELNRACTLCLEKGHNSSECKVLFRCTVPGCRSSRHNVLLHPDRSSA